MLFAQDPTGGPNPLDFVQYGVLGLVLAALLLGWLWAKPAVDSLRKDKERAEEQRDQLTQVYEERVIPALMEANQISAAFKPVLEEVLKALEDLDDRGRSS